ncbi:MAG: hypothetical protein J7M29_00360 [Verrucomicrobia bacterium]|nr:hypothetical protein [Verrucomicrobiota bacterium]
MSAINRREALKKVAVVGTAAAAAGAVAAKAQADVYNFANEEDQVEVVGGWLTSKKGNKHMPIVKVEREGDIATIAVEVKHPQGAMHHIEAVHLYDEDRLLIASAYFHPERSKPKATFALRVPQGAKLLAVGDCNLHGLWFTEFVV